MNEFKKEAIDELIGESEIRLQELRNNLKEEKVHLEKYNIKFEMKDLYGDTYIARNYDDRVNIYKENIEKTYNNIAREEAIIEQLKSIK